MVPSYARASTIIRIHPETRREIRAVAQRATRLYPNAHLGADTAREDIHSAFLLVRSYVASGLSLLAAVARVDRDLDSYEDM